MPAISVSPFESPVRLSRAASLIVGAVAAHVRRHGTHPRAVDVVAALGCQRTAAAYHLENLRARGVLELLPGKTYRVIGGVCPQEPPLSPVEAELRRLMERDVLQATRLIGQGTAAEIAHRAGYPVTREYIATLVRLEADGRLRYLFETKEYRTT